MTAHTTIGLDRIPIVTVEGARQELARRSLRDFVAYTKLDYDFNWHHELLCEYLDRFISGEITKLLLHLPPQHGKTELATRRLPAFILGKDPTKRIAVVSYNATVAQSFNRDIQRIMDDVPYHEVFPDTVLSASNVTTNRKKGYLRNNTVFETVPHRGAVRTVGVDGALTSFKVDIGIFDDLYKSRKDAMSNKRREIVQSFYKSVFVPRLHNDSQQLGVFTRWDEHDLGGYLVKNSKGWTVLNIPALKVKEVKYYHDPRPIGGALWPNHLSQEALEDIKKESPIEFEAMYQQDPSAPKELLILTNWEEIEEMPNGYPKFYGSDLGFTHDPTTMIEMEYDSARRTLWVDELEYRTGMTKSDIVTATKAHQIGKRRIWMDHDKRLIKELILKGLNVFPAIKGPGSVLEGLTELRGLKKIYVTRRSHNIKRELANYQWVADADGKPTNQPLENGNDHTIDGIRYGYIGYTKPRMK